MPLYTTTPNTRESCPDEHGPLVVQPFMDVSITAQVATTVTTSAKRYRIPTVTADPTEAWLAEGADIPI